MFGSLWKHARILSMHMPARIHTWSRWKIVSGNEFIMNDSICMVKKISSNLQRMLTNVPHKMCAPVQMQSAQMFAEAIVAHINAVRRTTWMILRIESKMFKWYENQKNNYLLKKIYSSRCKRISLTCEQGDMECYRRPASITYHFITLVSNMSLPPTGRVLFTYKGPSWYENIDFDMKILHAQAPANIRRVSDKYFR